MAAFTGNDEMAVLEAKPGVLPSDEVPIAGRTRMPFQRSRLPEPMAFSDPARPPNVAASAVFVPG